MNIWGRHRTVIFARAFAVSRYVDVQHRICVDGVARFAAASLRLALEELLGGGQRYAYRPALQASHTLPGMLGGLLTAAAPRQVENGCFQSAFV